MTRLKDQIRLAKKALKEARVRPDLYSENELKYMALQLARAKILLKEKQLRRRREKGFSNELSETSNRNTRRRKDDGLRGKSEQSEQPGEPEGSGTT
tara:strand:- start:1373 stop:1663 length:291 start_codon:yes stop_codon:yes gene_type:complete